METRFWAVKNGGKYFSQMGQGHIYYSDRLDKAHRFDNQRGAEFMAGRLGGHVVECVMKDGKLVENVPTAEETEGQT